MSHLLRRDAIGTALNANQLQIWEHENIMKNHYKRLCAVRPHLDNQLYGGRKLSKRSPANRRHQRRIIDRNLERKRLQERNLNRLAKIALGKSVYHVAKPQDPRRPVHFRQRRRRKRRMKQVAKKPPLSPRKPIWNDSVYNVNAKHASHRSNMDIGVGGIQMKWEELLQNPGKWQHITEDTISTKQKEFSEDWELYL